MSSAKEYSIAVIDKYSIYFQGLQALIREQAGPYATISHFVYDNHFIAKNIFSNRVNLFLFHVPLYMSLHNLKQLLLQLKKGDSTARIIIYCSEHRADIVKNIKALKTNAIFFLHYDPVVIASIIRKELADLPESVDLANTP